MLILNKILNSIFNSFSTVYIHANNRNFSSFPTYRAKNKNNNNNKSY